MRKDDDGRTYLVTPAEKIGVDVEDAHFLAVEMAVEGSGETQTLTFRTNVDDVVAVDKDHPLRFKRAEPDGGLKPYVLVRGRLEALLHPLIMEEAGRRSARAGGTYQVVVVPLLFEAGLERSFDRVLVVDCPEADQRRRLQARDGESAASIERILAAQMRREARLQRADDVIANDGTLTELAERVRALHVKFVQWAGGLKK